MGNDDVIVSWLLRLMGYEIYCVPEAVVYHKYTDIRELQLAKGAIRAGIELLMKEAGVNVGDVRQILLSGVFGNYINRQKALTLGLFPPFPVDRIHFVGNAAMEGALKALLNLEERQRAEEIAAQVSYVELAGRTDFDETFLRCLELGVE